MSLIRGSVQHLPLADNSVDMIFCDPPYLREYLPAYGWLAVEAMRVLKPGAFVLAMCGGSYINQIFRMFDDAGLTYYWEYDLEMGGAETGVVWRRNGHNMPISTRTKRVIAYSKGMAVSRTATNGTFRSDSGDKRFHQWGQDVASARYFVDCFTSPGDLVLDPFIGGGTTAAACELIGRRCIGLDIAPKALRTTADRMAGIHPLSSAPLLEMIA